MELLQYDRLNVVKDFEEQCPVLWNVMQSIMAPQSSETSKQIEKGFKNAYFVMNHIVKLVGGNSLTARAAVVGIFLESQGNFTTIYKIFL